MSYLPIQTKRLVLRNFIDDDAPEMKRIFSDARVAALIPGGRPEGETGTEAWVSGYQVHQALYGLAYWAVIDKLTGQFIGEAGFEFEVHDEDLTCEIGYTFTPEVWGHGYATEATEACLEVAFAQVGIPRVIALADVNNEPSTRLLKRLGFTYLSDTENSGLPHHVWELTAVQWSASRGGGAATKTHPAFAHEQQSNRLLELAAHPNSAARYNMVRALPEVLEYRPDERAVAVLIELTRDQDEDVRDWSCFGLNVLDVDTPSVRDALRERLDDPHADTRGEALEALAKLGDPALLPALKARLSEDSVWTMEVVAAGITADPSLYPLLKDRTWAEDDSDLSKLEFAKARCRPDAAEQASSYESAFLNRLNGQLESLSNVAASITGTYPHSTLKIIRNGETIDEQRVWIGRHPFDGVDPVVAAESWFDHIATE